MRVPVRLAQGTLTHKFDESMSRGVGSRWDVANVEVSPANPELPRRVVATMLVPEDMEYLSDEELLKRFVAGFNGGK